MTGEHGPGAGAGPKPGGAIVSQELLVDCLPAESGDFVGGFSMVESINLHAAIELARARPMPDSGGTVKVRPLVTIGDLAE